MNQVFPSCRAVFLNTTTFGKDKRFLLVLLAIWLIDFEIPKFQGKRVRAPVLVDVYMRVHVPGWDHLKKIKVKNF